MASDSVSLLPASGAAEGAPVGRFDGREQFQDWIRRALLTAAVQGWQQITLCDKDFRDWPIGEVQVVDALNAWARGGRGRKCTLLAKDFELLRRRHPRFVDWRVRWGHLLDCRQVMLPAQSTELPSVFWSSKWVLHCPDTERLRGVATENAERCVAWRENLREWSTSRSRAGFPSTILGL